MGIASIGSSLGQAGQRAKGIARDRLMHGPETNQDARRPRTTPGGFLGEGPEIDPTAETGLLEGLLKSADSFLQQPQTPQDITPPTERTDRRAPNDERRSGGLLRPRKPPEEDAPLMPGNPGDLGARARRRRREDDTTPSPVLRRGLLGV